MPTHEPVQPRRTFRRLTLSLILALTLLAGALAAVNLMQPPRLAGAESNRFALTEYPGTSLTLHLTQPVAAVEKQHVSVSPYAPFEVESEGTAVMIRFIEPLDYGTEYDLTLEFTSALTGVSGTATHTFNTPDTEVFTLLRAADGRDRIEAQDLGTGGSHRSVYEAGHIQEFSRLSDQLLVVTVGEGEEPNLISFSMSEKAEQTVAPVGMETITDLQVEPRTSFVGYLATGQFEFGRPLERALLLNDASAEPGMPIVVSDESGNALSVADWRFVPGTTSVAVLTAEQELLLIDPVLGRPTVSYGEFEALSGFLPASSQLVAVQGGTEVVVDLANAYDTDLSEEARQQGLIGVPTGLPRALAPTDEIARVSEDTVSRLYLSRERAVQRIVGPEGGGQVRLIEFDASEGAATDDARDDAVLFAPASPTSRLGSICLSPNGRLLAVEVVSAEGVPDGYPEQQRFSATTTSFVELSSGRTIRSVNGTLSDWC